jgi:hypothetical protein
LLDVAADVTEPCDSVSLIYAVIPGRVISVLMALRICVCVFFAADATEPCDSPSHGCVAGLKPDYLVWIAP